MKSEQLPVIPRIPGTSTDHLDPPNGNGAILKLDDDALFLVLSEVVKQGETLRSASTVSRRIRRICLPLFFRRCTTSLIMNKGLIPSAIWPYIQTLTFRGSYRSVNMSAFPKELPHLPFLHSIHFDGIPAVPWAAILECFSAPALRTLEFINSPVAQLTDVASCLPFSLRLACLVYKPKEWIETLNAYAGNGLNLLLELTRNSIESLTIPARSRSDQLRLSSVSMTGVPSKCVRGRSITTSSFPRLHELTIQGSYPIPDDPEAFIHSLSSTNAHLRSLSVKLPHRQQTARIRLWPIDNYTDVTFQQMESLEISYPNPTDGIFDRLTGTLRRLSLRDYPRYYFAIDPFLRTSLKGSAASILSSSECLQILRKCPLISLEELEIVYKSDDRNRDLLRYIAAHCPNVKRLEIHRYREHRNDGIDLDELVQTLASLHRVRTLRLHLDLPDAPHPHAASHCDSFIERLTDLATTITTGLSPTLQQISILLRIYSRNQWLTWYIHRDPLFRLELSKDWLWNEALVDAEGPPDVLWGYRDSLDEGDGLE